MDPRRPFTHPCGVISDRRFVETPDSPDGPTTRIFTRIDDANPPPERGHDVNHSNHDPPERRDALPTRELRAAHDRGPSAHAGNGDAGVHGSDDDDGGSSARAGNGAHMGNGDAGERPLPPEADPVAVLRDGLQDAVDAGWDLSRIEQEYILTALDALGGQKGATAEALGISRRTLYRKLRSYRAAGVLEAP